MSSYSESSYGNTTPLSSKAHTRVATRGARISTLLLTFAVFALITCNLLTLTVDTVHASGFNALKSILSASMPEAAVLKLLSRSPTHVSAVRTEVSTRISKRVARRAVVNAGKNLSSLAGELVPIAGTAVILALTASDLYDDCQTLKDMNELGAAFDNENHDEATVCGMKVPFQ